MELQQVLVNGECVGRLHVGNPSGEPDAAGYTAYAKKVLVYERHIAEAELLGLLLCMARDGTAATEMGHQLLLYGALRSRPIIPNDSKGMATS